MMNQKRWIWFVLAALTLLAAGCSLQNNRPSLTIYLHNGDLLSSYAPLLQEMLPEAELEFVVGRDSVDFYLFRQKHGDLPDIITMGGGLALRDSVELNEYLMDLSGTETASSFYDTYLESYRDDAGHIKWLPAGAIANGIIANVDLFEQYGIPLPADYAGFAAACKAFAAQGIQPYTTDYKYNYTCLYTLEGWSIPSLMSRQGVEWRRQYERGLTDELDEGLWTAAFDRLSRVIEDTGMGPAEVERGYTITREDFLAGKVPMVRGIVTELSDYSQYHRCVFLPYFGGGEGDNWLLTAPRFHVALNNSLNARGNEQKKELALRVLDIMFSAEGYSALTTDGYIYMLPYNRGVEASLPGAIENLEPLIEANHLFILMNSETMQNAALGAVHGMLRGDLDPRAAFAQMATALSQPAADQTVAATLDAGYPVSFRPDTGNQAASAVVNTLRAIEGSDLLLAPASICSGSLYAGDYTEQQLEESVQSSGNRLFTAQLSGAEIHEIVRLAVEGYGSINDPFSSQTLPVCSGFTIAVEKTADNAYRLADILVNGASLTDDASFSFTVADLPSQFQELLEKALGDNAAEKFTASEQYARLLWVEYIKAGGQPTPPSTYITLRESRK